MEPIKDDPKNPLHSLRTYQGDVDEALSKNKTSVSSIVIAEQKRRDSVLSSPEDDARAANRNKYVVWIGGALVVIGLLVVIVVYYNASSSNQVTIVQKTKTLIGFSVEKDIPITNASGGQITQAISKEVNAFKLPPNSILYINTTTASSTPAEPQDVLSLIAPQIPGVLSRSFENQYMIGVYSFDRNAPFIIFTTTDYASSFAGMLKWEPNMVSDIGSIFGITSTSTPVFLDKSLQNKDLRVLKDDNGQTILLYSFIDKNTLVITTKENILTGIIGKYLISKTTK